MLIRFLLGFLGFSYFFFNAFIVYLWRSKAFKITKTEYPLIFCAVLLNLQPYVYSFILNKHTQDFHCVNKRKRTNSIEATQTLFLDVFDEEL